MLEEENYRMDVDDESELPASWGAGGLELDDVPVSAPMARSGSSSGGKKSKNSDDAGTKPKLSAERLMDEWEASRDRRAGGLLWSANYFFYSKYVRRSVYRNKLTLGQTSEACPLPHVLVSETVYAAPFATRRDIVLPPTNLSIICARLLRSRSNATSPAPSPPP